MDAIVSFDYDGDTGIGDDELEAGRQKEILYQQLHQAIVQGDWERASNFLELNPYAITDGITEDEDTPLIFAVKQGVKIQFLEKLLEKMENMTPQAFGRRNAVGNTALHAAASRGNTGAAELLLKKDPNLRNCYNYGHSLPLHLAAMHGRREMTEYLLKFELQNPFKGESGSSLIHHLINSRFYDIALRLLESNKKLAYKPECPLKIMAQDPSTFPSGLRFNTWQKFKYFLLPHLKHIRDTKLLHDQVLQLVHHICKEVVCLRYSEASSLLKEPFLIAAKNGIHEVVEEIQREFPSAIGFTDEDNNTAFHLAIMYRHEKVFNFINENGGHEGFLSHSLDNNGNNILHLAGYLAREKQFNLASPTILQVQRELQWYKEVERLVLPAQMESKNNEGKTPFMVFIEQHSNMIRNEEQWMKGMANSCTVAATLIGGVAFAAAISIPGGNNNDGFPVLTKETSFMIFNISNIVALFSSLSTVIIFLAILISRYKVDDFLHALPRRLIMGLLSLFLSITSMIISFSAAVYVVSPQRKVFIILPAVLSCVPVTLFLLLQFPLLLNLIKFTYFPRIFISNKSNKKS